MWFVTFLVILVVGCFWRVRSTIAMLNDTRDDERYGHS